MRIISVSPCKHFDCSNRNSFGYCKTTVCINEHYQQEQWGSPSTTNKSESVVKKPQTNADRIRAMSDEELAKSIARIAMCVDCKIKNPTCTLPISNCEKSWLEWLKQEADI